MRRPRRDPTLVLLFAAFSLVLSGQTPRRRRTCPGGTVSIAGLYCIDRFEGALQEIVGRRTVAWSPYTPPATGHRYRAISRPGAVPQGYISQVQARAACANAGKRLCTEREWEQACRGPATTQWPYGNAYVRGRCNDGRTNPVSTLFGSGNVFHESNMNDPRLNQLPRTLARTGQHTRCRSRFGVSDMVGNLHEWVEGGRGGHGVFRGGYYVDVHINGEGCGYATRAHGPGYHDYSTGFRCCADLR